MTLLNTIQSSGITIGMVQLAIIAGIVVYIIGTYWKVLLTGAAVILAAVILLYSDGKEPGSSIGVESRSSQSTPSSVLPSIKPIIQSAPDAFIDDCMKDAEYTKEECEKIWTNP